MLLAAPIVLLLGLGALQWALLLHARTAIEYALFEAARAGSVAQARPDAIESGLARGLLPFWQGAAIPRAPVAALAAAKLRLGQGLAAGWIDWRQLAPTIESFDDWAEPASDAFGRPTPGTLEIPNDSLQWSWLRMPTGGIAGMRGREPIGARSEQTLNDANLLKLELRYGVPLSVPLVGSIAAWLMRILDGCEAPSRRRLGLVDLGTPLAAAPRAWTCPIYRAPDASGRIVSRWPVRVTATVRMQSAARRSTRTQHRTESPMRAASLPGGGTGSAVPSVDPVSSVDVAPPIDAVPPIDVAPPIDPAPWTHPVTPGGAPRLSVGADADGSRTRDAGWLNLGGERSFSVPGACDA
ncbi:MAG: pilus assembly protein [Burkholderiaceae bacterium]|nr:pilus assembly protein [Burkholderiaceae bacterium]